LYASTRVAKKLLDSNTRSTRHSPTYQSLCLLDEYWKTFCKIFRINRFITRHSRTSFKCQQFHDTWEAWKQ